MAVPVRFWAVESKSATSKWIRPDELSRHRRTSSSVLDQLATKGRIELVEPARVVDNKTGADMCRRDRSFDMG